MNDDSSLAAPHTAATDTSATHTAATQPPKAYTRWLREPLLHFLLIGAAVFAVDASFGKRNDDRNITVSLTTQEEARNIFMQGMKREPTERDLKVLLDRWVDNEVLYREGLALGLDRGDSAIRDRVIFKSLGVVQAGLTLPAIDEKGLQAWFESKRDVYDTPARFDFYEAVLPGSPSEEQIRQFADALNGAAKSDTESSLRVFKERPRPSIVQSYGEPFAHALETLPKGRWAALPSAAGLRIARLDAMQAAVPAVYADIRDTVYQNWKDETMSRMTTDAVRTAARKYRVSLEEARK